MVVVVMGPSGAGKTTIGRALAVALGWAFLEADEFHSAANVDKMRAGVGLTDADRQPWLAAVRSAMREAVHRGDSLVVACSALKQRYREFLRDGLDDVRFVHLAVDRAELAARLAARRNHFAGPAIVDGQLQALETPGVEALTVDGTDSPDRIVAHVVRALELSPHGH